MPAAASATISPSLMLTPSAVSAGATVALGLGLTFSPSSGDYPASLTLTLPPGLLLSAALSGGACLSSATPVAGCELGSGTQSMPLMTPVSLWLVKGPSAADIAGLALVAGTTPGAPEATAAITLRTTPDIGLNLSFASLPGSAATPLGALNLTLSGLRVPTACPGTPATVAVSATSSQASTPQTTTAPLTVTGCGSLPYTPTLAAKVDRNATNSGATFTATLTAPATGSATRALAVQVPASITPNLSNVLVCLTSAPCTIGTASAISPFLPSSALGNGAVKLGGSIFAPQLSVTFPAPYPITLTGTIDLSTDTLTFNDVPDLPLTSLAVQIGGASGTQLFATSCAPSSLTVKLTPWDGTAQKTIATPITFGGSCPAIPPVPSGPTTTVAAKPTLSGATLRGLVKHSARLTFTVKQGKQAKPIERIALGLPRGLALARKKASLVKGIVVGGPNGKKVKFKTSVSHGVLTITLSAAAAKAEVTLASPALAVRSRLANSVKSQLRRKKVAALRFGVRLTDSAKTTTRLTLKLRPRS